MSTQPIELSFQDYLQQAGVAAPDADLYDACVRCGLCLQSCPTYTLLDLEASSPRGRIALIRGVNEGRIPVDAPGFLKQMDQCLGCLACQAVCPSGVEYGHLLEAGRAQAKAVRPQPRKTRLIERFVFGWLFMSLGRVRLLAVLMAIYQRTGLQWLARRLGVLKLMGMAQMEQLLPRMSRSFVKADGRSYAPMSEAAKKKRVALLTGCVQSVAFAEVHEATVHALRVNGCEVVMPQGQECCGALHAHGGDLVRAKVLARRNIDALAAVKPDYVVVNAAGCSHHVKEYAHLLHDDPVYGQRAEHFVSISRDVTELLAELGPKPARTPLPWRVTYQEPCHLVHGQKVSQQPRQILSAIPGLTFVEMAESSMCCGSAGTYNILQPEIAGQLLDRKLENTAATQAEVVLSANTGCMIQMRAGIAQRGMNAKVMHLVEVLDAAYRQDETLM